MRISDRQAFDKSSYARRYMTPEKNKGLAATYLLTLSNLGAGERSRTPDLLITNELLYQLSYTGNSPQV